MPNRDLSEYTPDDWRRVGRAIAERMGQLGMSQTDLVRVSGVSDLTIRPLQYGEPKYTPRDTTLVNISRALRWPHDAIRHILAGDDPRDIETLIEPERQAERRRPPSYDERINALPPAARHLVLGVLESALELAERELGNDGRGRNEGNGMLSAY